MKVRLIRRAAVLLVVTAVAACDQPAPEVTNNAAAQVKPVQASGVADRLAKAGLPVIGVTSVTATTDPDHLLGRPGQYTSKALFSDGRHGSKGQSTIEVFASPADAMKRAEVVTSGAKDAAAITQYQAVSGKVYLRLDEALPAAEADRYLKAFSTMES